MLRYLYYAGARYYHAKKKWTLAAVYYDRALAKAKTGAASWHYQMGFVCSKARNWPVAVKHLKIAAAAVPGKLQWQYRLALALDNTGKKEAALEIYQTVLQTQGPDPVKLARIGNLLMGFSRWVAAEDAYRAAISHNSKQADYFNKLAQALRKQGKWWQEIDALTSAIELDAGHPSWHYRLGEAQEVMKRWEASACAYQKAVSLDSSNGNWHYRLGYVLEKLGKIKQSNEAYAKAIERDATKASKTLGIGFFHQARGYWADAAYAYAEKLQTSLDNAELNHRLGMAHDRCFEWNLAAEAYERALCLDYNNLEWHYRLGFVRERMGQYQDAALAYQHAASNNPKHTPYWFYRLGQVLCKAGDHQAACQAYLRTSEQQTVDKLVSIDSYYVQISEGHIKRLIEMIEVDATDANVWFDLGTAYERLEKWSLASEAYEAAINRKNAHTPTWFYRLGHVLAKAEYYQEACAAFKNIRILQNAYGVPQDHFNRDKGFRQAAVYTEYYETLDVQEKTILYESFHGSVMSCNPLALFLHLLKRKEFYDWKHIWVINDVSKIPLQFRRMKNVSFVSRDSDLYMRYVASSQVLINNSTFPTWFIRKPEQKYLNTWHGTPWKSLGKDIKSGFMELKNTARNFLHATHIISPNPHTTHVLIDRYDIAGIYNGIVAETGYPRIDLTLNSTEQDKLLLRQRLGLENDKKVVLYAPTWRGTLGSPEMETEQLIEEIRFLSKLNCRLLFRGHYFVESAIYESALGSCVVPEDINSNELLSIVDILITDYSSIAFDFMATGRPILYYLNDYEKYKNERGLYFDVGSLPGLAAYDIESLKNILDKTLVAHEEHTNYTQAKNNFCPNEDGKACSRVIDFLMFGKSNELKVRPTENKKSMLFFGGVFIPNGITTSFLNLLENIDKSRFSVAITIDPDAVSRYPERFEQFSRLPEKVQVLSRSGRMNLTIEEKWVIDVFNRFNGLSNKAMLDVYQRAFTREFIRSYGYASFDTLIQFEGYSRFWSSIFAFPMNRDTTRTIIYQHNDKYSEWVMRFPYLESIFRIYNEFDKVASVSKQTRDLNIANLANKFNVPQDKFIYVDNLQNPEEIRRMSSCPVQDHNEIQLFKESEFSFITMGRLSPEKDHQKLVYAMRDVCLKYPKTTLFILGDGPLWNTLNQLIRELDLLGNIHLLGRKLNPFPYLKLADCFVLSSNHEGQPMVLLEAMILEKPIVATDIVGNRSVLEGRGGLLVENNIDGLARGMLQHVEGNNLSFSFNSSNYQKDALNMFYEKVIDHTDFAS